MVNRKRIWGAVTLSVLLCGCPRPEAGPGRPAVDSQLLQKLRAAHIADVEPHNAIGIEAFRSQLVEMAKDATDLSRSEDSGESDEINDSALSTAMTDVVLFARVGGTKLADGPFGESFPWDTGKAHFAISDPDFQAESDSHAHSLDDPDHDCPFCKKAKNKASKSMAYVRLRDESGDTIKVDARDLFGLSGDETIVIEGRGRLTVGTMMIEADKIHVRPSPQP